MENVTCYMHAAAYHLSKMVQQHHNLKQFSTQGTYESFLENCILYFKPIIFPLVQTNVKDNVQWGRGRQSADGRRGT